MSALRERRDDATTQRRNEIEMTEQQAQNPNRRAVASLRRCVSLLSTFATLGLLACGGPDPAVPRGPHVELPKAFARAFETDATGDAHAAVGAYLGVARAAAVADDDAWQVPALEASLDALATRSMPSMGEAGNEAALAWRTADGPTIAAELGRLEGRGTFAHALVARTLTSMAQRRGDAAEAERQRAASGCAREAVVIGPATWAPILGVEEAGPLDRADAALAASYPRGDAFATQAQSVPVRGRGCAIDLSAESTRPGVREVVVDVDVPRAQLVGVVLRARGAAALRAGGTPVLRRPFDLGDGPAARFARVKSTEGTLRLVARVGTAKDDDSVELDVLGEDGAPLRAHAPAVGSTATARVLGVSVLDLAAPHGTDDTLLEAAADLAASDPRSAERMLWGRATRADSPPELALVYARALETSRDLSLASRSERARSAYERVLDAWPASWEASLAHAVLAGARRGREEAGLEILHDLSAQRAKAGGPRGVLDAFEAITAARERVFDRAASALERARGSLAGTSLLAYAQYASVPKTGTELVASLCDPARALPQDSLACLDALRTTGDRAGAARELQRVRSVLGAPSRYLAAELRDALVAGDLPAANQAFQAMLPAERTLSSVAALDPSPEVRERLLKAAVGARDAPGALDALLHAAGDDPTRELDGTAERLAAQDRASPILPNAATAVLLHTERYDVAPSGLVRWLLFDVRRVSGTTDVQDNAEASAPDVWGRGSARILRRRIFKHDGRVLDPEATPRASQAGADLSTLEQGDIIEAIYEGWALPGDTGDLGIDTPDLLPERTAVHEATIDLHLPPNLHGALWSHPLLGKAQETSGAEGRVVRWHVVDHPGRRVEDGVPQMDRSARVSFATSDWATVSKAVRETLAALDEREPEIRAWALDATAPGSATRGGTPEATRATVEAIVTAAGRTLREGDASALSDYSGGIAAVQQLTARTSLSSHSGSRSWLVLRALRELGVPSELVVAENDPFSADPAFPAHFGRFTHPLVVAHVQGQDVWIDADIEGPPLPAGRISPELRGRLALRADGTIAPLPAVGDRNERDEVDVRLVLDAHGDARGTFAVVLEGREAQQLAEALVRSVGAERQRALRDVVLAWLPWANVDDVQLSSSEGSWQVSLRADVSIDGYAQLEGAKTWLLPGLDTMHSSSPHARVSSLGATFATRAGRESALALSRAVQYHVHRRVELPKGARVSRMPGPLDLKSHLVEASRKLVVSGAANGNVEDDFVLGVATGTIAAKDYDAFVSLAHAADDGFLAATRVAVP